MRRTYQYGVAAAAACFLSACRESTPPGPDADGQRPLGRAEQAAGTFAGTLVTNGSWTEATLVPLANATVVMVRVADLLPQFEPRNAADGSGGPLEHCGGPIPADAPHAISNRQGEFAITGLAEGSYDVTVLAASGWSFTAYCAFQIPANAARRVQIYVPPATLSGDAPARGQ